MCGSDCNALVPTYSKRRDVTVQKSDTAQARSFLNLQSVCVGVRQPLLNAKHAY